MKHRFKWKLLYFAAAIGMLLLGACAIVAMEPLRHEASSFSADTCQVEPGGSGNVGDWVSRWDNDDLIIRTTVCANCADAVSEVTAQVIGAFILVRVHLTSPSDGVAAGCNCQHAADLRLSRLPKRDYTIIRVGAPWLRPSCV